MADTKITDINHEVLMADIERLNILLNCQDIISFSPFFDIDKIVEGLNKDKNECIGKMAEQTKILNENICSVWEEFQRMVSTMSESLVNVETILKERDSL